MKQIHEDQTSQRKQQGFWDEYMNIYLKIIRAQLVLMMSGFWSTFWGIFPYKLLGLLLQYWSIGVGIIATLVSIWLTFKSIKVCKGSKKFQIVMAGCNVIMTIILCAMLLALPLHKSELFSFPICIWGILFLYTILLFKKEETKDS